MGNLARPLGRMAKDGRELDPYRGYYNALVGRLDAPEVVVDAFHIVRVRREAPCVRAGGRSPPSVCRSRPLKLGAA